MFKVWDLKTWIFQIFQSQEGLHLEIRGWIKITCLINNHQQAKLTVEIAQDVFFSKSYSDYLSGIISVNLLASSLHIKLSFVNINKVIVNCAVIQFYWRHFWMKTSFFCTKWIRLSPAMHTQKHFYFTVFALIPIYRLSIRKLVTNHLIFWLILFYTRKENSDIFEITPSIHLQKSSLPPEILSLVTAWNGSVFRIILVRIFPHSNWKLRDTEYLSVFSPYAGKCGPE